MSNWNLNAISRTSQFPILFQDAIAVKKIISQKKFELDQPKVPRSQRIRSKRAAPPTQKISTLIAALEYESDTTPAGSPPPPPSLPPPMVASSHSPVLVCVLFSNYVSLCCLLLSLCGCIRILGKCILCGRVLLLIRVEGLALFS